MTEFVLAVVIEHQVFLWVMAVIIIFNAANWWSRSSLATLATSAVAEVVVYTSLYTLARFPIWVLGHFFVEI